ncbi:unnamed protein product [Oikopleura dioica]|uniref:Uncharacterized protein n=1 Tax=Oikopleura dioica TaxID=34765 RepID=E4XEI6_OIKDI|nr:unnamed protein product [Oikopleura dioica]
MTDRSANYSTFNEMGNAQDPAENTMLTEEQEKPPSCFLRSLSCACTSICVVFGISIGVAFGLPFGYFAAFLFVLIGGPLYCCGWRFNPASASLYKKGSPQAPPENSV